MEHTFLGATRSDCLDGQSKLFHVEQFSRAEAFNEPREALSWAASFQLRCQRDAKMSSTRFC
jgi:hypothetical protein